MPEFSVTTPQRTYPILVERGSIARLSEFIPETASKVFIVTSHELWQHLKHRVTEDFEILYLPAGEDHKRLAPLEELAVELVTKGADRLSVIVAIGGGIVGDMAGFLGAMFMRGIDVIQVPSTLLGQVDAAIGGKTGVNLPVGKNLIGAFHQPIAVLCDPAVLETLPRREYIAGLYEVIKYGVISNRILFETLEQKRDLVLAMDPPTVDSIVAECARIKADVVMADEKEKGLRQILNFGHTFGHALEAETSFSRFLHGEAVAFGMRAATILASGLNLIPEADASRILSLIQSYGPIPSLENLNAPALQHRLMSDKKTRRGRIHFVLPRAIGEVQIATDVPENTVLRAIEQALA